MARLVILVLIGTAPFSEASKLGSIYEIPLRWVDETGAPVTLSQWRGPPLIVTMTYTSCRMTCPLTVKKLKAVDEALKEAGKPVEFVVVTLDPRFDTPGRLTKYYRNSFQITSSHWHFLRGDEATTKRLASWLGIAFENIDGHIRHDNKFVMLDRAGNPKRTLEGWSTSLDEFIAGCDSGPGQRPRQ